MPKKYYGWILFGVFIFVAGILLTAHFSFFKKNGPEVSAPPLLNSSSSNSAGENASSGNETMVEIDMENSDADFEADADDFESDLEDLNDFDEDIDLESIDDAELF